MGGITDYFPEYAISVLETLNLALAGKSRIAMVGQGIGPLENTELRARAAAILPKVDLIGLREKRASAPLLRALGVPSDRIVATGDDAIEMAHEVRKPKLGTGIGINLRIADYSGVDSTILDGLSRVLHEASHTFLAPLLPVPISRVPGEADLVRIRCLMPESAAELKRAAAMRTPLEIVRQIQRCRVVVTGSYHAGVFALANGIPTVGLAGNAYYVDKFRGLADMFGSGCEVVLIKDKCHLDILRSALQQLWHAAPDIRPGILASAEEQIAAGHAAYRRLYELVIAKQAASSPHP
jgi:colanic acid/amylovoran biosynthesis protein